MSIAVATIGFLLAVGSAFFWASLDITRKRIGQKMSATAAVATLMLFQAPYILPVLVVGQMGDYPADGSVFNQILLQGFPSIGAEYVLPAVASVMINLLANFLFLRSVQISPLSLTTPYLAFTPVFTAIVALMTLGEIPTRWGWIGITIVCLGAFFMNPGTKEDGPLAPLKALWTERGSFYMLIVALLWSITPVLDKRAAGLTSPLWHTMFLATAVGLLFAIGRVSKDRGIGGLIREFKLTPAWVAAGGFFAVGAMVLQLSAYDYIDVAYVETVKRAIGVTAAVAAGYFMFGERDILRRLVGATVMCIGVAMILLGG